MTDVLICSMPLMHHMGTVPAAPAILKAAVKNAGYTASTIDLNLEYFEHQCHRQIAKYYEFGCVFRPSDAVTAQSRLVATQWVQHCIELIRHAQPRCLAISVFTNWQHRSTWLLLQALKNELPNLPVIIGGLGCEINGISLIHLDTALTKMDRLKPFWQLAKDYDMIDHVALGGGGSLDDLVKFIDSITGSHNHSVTDNQTLVMYNAPTPDYKDYKLDRYVWDGEPKIAITGSKGCVRACTFCDIPSFFGRFRTRQGQDIAKEMIHQHQQHGIKYFEFTDSLVNGSLKIFKEWLTVIADYNDQQPDTQRIKWFGQYICRPQSQTPKDIYSLMKRSGVTSLTIGVESGSNQVLNDMNKKMTVQDVYSELALFDAHGIRCNILMVSGFYTETQQDFIDSLHFIIQCQKYLAKGTIHSLGVSPPMYINEHMYIGIHADELGIVKDDSSSLAWTLKNDPQNTLVSRVQKRIITQLVMDLLGYAAPSQSISAMHEVYTALTHLETRLTQELNNDSQTLVV